METLQTLIARVNREFGTQVATRPLAKDLSNCPSALKSFYAETDGLDLPFLELFSMAKFKIHGVPGWLVFGSDRYFSYCLCSTESDCELPFDLWDHEAEDPPEGSFAGVLDLLVFAYQDFTEHGLRPCALVLRAVPPDVKLAFVVKRIKAISTGTSAQLLGRLRNLPIELPVESISQGIGILRDLQNLGVDCHISVAT